MAAREGEAANPYPRSFCFMTSPFCSDGEYEDTYVRDIVGASQRFK
jgi:hypothetical protein